MKNLKKVLALVIVLSMMISMFTVMTTSAVSADFTDIAGADCEEAVKILAPMGVIVGYEEEGAKLFKPDQIVTRAEMASFIMRELGNKIGVKTATIFKDVDSEFWASGWINMANSKNIVVGYGDGNFGPDNQVTFEEAVKMLVCALGYEEDAKDNGGWSTGYLVMADKKDLLVGLEDKLADASAGCDRGTVAQLLYNALDIEIQDVTYYDGKVLTKTLSGRTMASEMGYTKFEEVVVNATETTAFKGSLQKAGYVALEGVKGDVLNGGYSLDQYLGEAVTIYASYDKKNAEYQIVSLIGDSAKGDVVILEAADIYGMSGSELKYYIDKDSSSKTSSYTLDALATDGGQLTMVYNNKPVAAEDQDYEMITSATNGIVKLIDNSKDGVYERVILETYKNYQVLETNVEDYELILKDAVDEVSVQLDDRKESNRPKFSIVSTDGTALTLEDLAEDDVVSVYSDVYPVQVEAGDDYVADAESLRLIVSTDTVEGAVSQISNKKVYIDGEAYETDGVLTTGSFAIEDEGIFFLDFNGDIAFHDTDVALDNFEFAYDGILNGREITLYTMNSTGEKVSYKMASTVRVNGTSYSMSNSSERAALASVLKIDGSTGLTDQYVVSLRTNENNEITRVTVLDGTESTGYFSKGDKILGNYNVSDKTVMFTLPAGLAFDEDELKVQSFSSLENSKTYQYKVCDVDKNGIATVVVIYTTGSSIDLDSDIAIIKSVSSIKVNDEIVLSVEMLQGGKTVTKNTKDYDQFFITSAYEEQYGDSAKIAYGAYPGQVIMYSMNAGAINNTFRLYPRPTTAAEYEADPTYYLTDKFQTWENNPQILRADTRLHLIAGTVTEKTTAITTLVVSSDAIPEAAPTDVNVNYGSARVTVVDTNRSTDVVYSGSSADIKVGDYVVVRKNKGATKDIIVYKNFVPAPQFYN